MWSRIRATVTVLLAAALLLTAVPVQSFAAAAEPVFKKTYAEMYDNLSTKGVYSLAVKNLKKGYLVKWYVTGGGKAYAKLAARKTTAKTTAVINKVTVNSNDETAYRGKRIKITARVYDKNNKLVKTLAMISSLKRKATAIAIDTSEIEDVERLTAGSPYQLSCILTPENATSRGYFKITDAAGKDCSAQVTADGVWTPVDEGTYTVMAYAKNSASGKVLCKNTITAKVGTFIQTVTQTASNKLDVTFNNDVSKKYKASDFSIKSDTAAVVAQKVKYSADGKTATVTTVNPFVDKKSYTVGCGVNSVSFVASVGTPVTLSILTDTVQAEKETKIEVALYDAKGIDVTDTAGGAFQFEGEVTNGVIDEKTHTLFMTTVGKVAKVSVSYVSVNGTTTLTATKYITCVAAYAEEAATADFTITDSAKEPDYNKESVKSIAIGDEMYAHFRALNEEDAPIKYDSILFSSADNNTLIVDELTGRLTPIKSGAVNVIVTAKQGNATVTYPFMVTVTEQRKLVALELSESVIRISNAYDMDYQKTISVKGRDQYGNVMSLDNVIGNVTQPNGGVCLAAYDAGKQAVIVKAQGAQTGSYAHVLEVTKNNVTVKTDFHVLVQQPSYNDAATYQIETDSTTVDMAVGTQTEDGMDVTVRVAEYRGGVFYAYKYFNDATIRKGNSYYNVDLTQPSNYQITIPAGNALTLKPVTITGGKDDAIAVCTKAAQGTYVITVNFTNDSGVMQQRSLALTLTDAQKKPEYTIRSLKASKSVSTAKELVNDCLSVSDGTITDCTATGMTQTGDAISITKGQQIHINQITVQTVETISGGRKVYVQHTVTVDKTFTNA